MDLLLYIGALSSLPVNCQNLHSGLWRDRLYRISSKILELQLDIQLCKAFPPKYWSYIISIAQPARPVGSLNGRLILLRITIKYPSTPKHRGDIAAMLANLKRRRPGMASEVYVLSRIEVVPNAGVAV